MHASTAREEAFTFPCEGETLIGVLHLPASSAAVGAAAAGVVVVVGGPQYRAGSHRLFVRLARAIASAGHPVLRFDVRGMGDSTGTLRTFEQITPDIGAAIDALMQRSPSVERVVLWGLCDAASASLLYLHDSKDTRVHGLCLINPWVRSDASLARTHVKHYYTRRLMDRQFWVKLFTGRVARRAVHDLIENLRCSIASPLPGASAMPFQARMASGWHHFQGQVLLILSGDDYTAREFLEFSTADPTWTALTNRAQVQRLNLPGADHTLSRPEDSTRAIQLTNDWFADLPGST